MKKTTCPKCGITIVGDLEYCICGFELWGKTRGLTPEELKQVRDLAKMMGMEDFNEDTNNTNDK